MFHDLIRFISAKNVISCDFPSAEWKQTFVSLKDIIESFESQLRRQVTHIIDTERATCRFAHNALRELLRPFSEDVEKILHEQVQKLGKTKFQASLTLKYFLENVVLLTVRHPT